MLLCLKCFRIYNQKTIKNNQCKTKSCQGNVVEVDELFIPVIAELNRKGYITKYCCSGHASQTSNDSNSYIYFEDNFKLPNLPEGYMYDKDIYPDVDWDKWTVHNTIRKIFNYTTTLNKLSKDIFTNAIAVLKWAEQLLDIRK
jgi:hypothetical protein